MTISRPSKLEYIIDDLRATAPISLSAVQYQQFVRAEELYRSHDPINGPLGESMLRSLFDIARQVEAGYFQPELEAELVGEPSEDGLYRSFESERGSTGKTLTHLRGLFLGLAILSAAAMVGWGTYAVYQLTNAKSAVAAGFCLLVVVAFSGFITHTVARLMQNAREADERMQLRSVLARAFARAVSIACARGDVKLLDRIVRLMPNSDSEHSRPVGPDDLVTWMQGLGRLQQGLRLKSESADSNQTDLK